MKKWLSITVFLLLVFSLAWYQYNREDKPLNKWSLGLMSGTSMDGIDVAAIRTNGEDVLEFGPTFFMPYAPEFREKLRSILGSTERTPLITEVEQELTQFHVDAVLNLIKESNLSPEDIDVVGFHGHTILHQSPKKHPKGRTWQIGDSQMLADKTGLTIVGNLRENDVAQGGEGAPLVPIFHKALCAKLEKPLAILNIGGVANITWMDDKEGLMAFDTGPGNALINNWMRVHTGAAYDKDGETASKGAADENRLKEWIKHPYFDVTPPKSLDRLDFSYFPKDLSLEDGAATLTAFTVKAVGEALKRVPEQPKILFVAGGGSHNKTILKLLQEHCAPTSIKTIDELGWYTDFLEAQAFAYLAKRSLKNLPNTFPGTTSAPKPLSGGKTYTPQK